jgi:hypothetical protein
LAEPCPGPIWLRGQEQEATVAEGTTAAAMAGIDKFFS